MLKIKMPAVGIDLGGTKIMIAAVNSEGIVGETIKVPTPKSPPNILNKFVELINQIKKEHLIAGIGIATPGIVDTELGIPIGATGNLPGWTDTKIKQIIESQTLLPVYVENDANAAAYAEAHTRNLKDKKCVIVLTIGTGIGGGILIDGKVFHGANHGAGHCGHIRISTDNKRLCTCGLFDCYEAYASGTGLLATAKEILANVNPSQSPLAKDLALLSNEAVFAAFTNKDLIAEKIINTWHKHLAIGMASLANALNPDCFVLGGGLCNFINYELLNEMLIDLTLPKINENLKVYKSELGYHAGMIGAAQLILDKLATVN